MVLFSRGIHGRKFEKFINKRKEKVQDQSNGPKKKNAKEAKCRAGVKLQPNYQAADDSTKAAQQQHK